MERFRPKTKNEKFRENLLIRNTRSEWDGMLDDLAEAITFYTNRVSELESLEHTEKSVIHLSNMAKMYELTTGCLSNTDYIDSADFEHIDKYIFELMNAYLFWNSNTLNFDDVNQRRALQYVVSIGIMLDDLFFTIDEKRD